MQQPSQPTLSREDFMAFFSDSKNINLLSAEDKAEIASRLIPKDQYSIKFFIRKVMDKAGFTPYQFIDERDSLPVF